MRKISILFGLISLFISQNIKAQQEINFGDFSKPVPSVSSLATYGNIPMSNATGLPEISIPLLGLPTLHRAIGLDLSLSYNPLNIAAMEPASEVGTGWSLFAGGVISRSIVNELDEKFDDTNTGNYTKNDFDDVYYYNLPGISGKFKMLRNTTANTFQLINLSSNKIKIEYTRENNAATLIFNSFTITDTKGIKYIFSDYSKSSQQQNIFGISNKIYKSAFFLSQIKDAGNIELANFTYQKDIKYATNGTSLLYQTCKLKTITSLDFGKIEINYTYDPNLENTLNDPYSINNILLKTKYNMLISGYSFEYSTYPFVYFNGFTSENANKRILTKLKKINKNNIVSETTEFRYKENSPNLNIPEYNGVALCPDPDITTNPHRAILGSLEKIITPTGGVTEYNFEPNQEYIDKSTSAYLETMVDGESFSDPELQYPEIFKEIDFNTSLSSSYTFTVTGTQGKLRKVYLLYHLQEKFPPPIYWDDSPTYVAWNIANLSDTNDGSYCNAPGSGYTEDYYLRTFSLLPGTYTIQFSGSGGKGIIHLYDLKYKTQPFRNANYINSLRIGSIKLYKSVSEIVPTKVTKYEYDSFTDVNSSSGIGFYPEVEGHEEGQKYVLYKNVKISNADDGNGYIKYYYKTPNDYPSEPYTVNGSPVSYWPYYSLTKGGVLEKKEVYNAQNSLLAKEQFDYTFDVIPAAYDYLLFGNGTNIYAKAAWLTKTNATSTTYFENNQSTEDQSETQFNVFNFEMGSTKKILDGNTIEQFFSYPESGYTHLSNANILSTPVMVVEKNDGKTVSKAETKYDNTASTLPTSMVEFNVNDNSTKMTKKMDVYDAKGNLLQFSSEAGIPTAIVYGYDQTLPIARIEGATYAQVSSLVQPIIDASNADAQNPINEMALITALENFRKNPALQNVQMTTYTYDPLIGVTSTTSPEGIREVYRYNANNQLEKIVDMNGVTLKEYQYNYKN